MVGMQAFLDAFAATLADNVHVALVLDGAGWHGKSLRVPTSITLVKLPPYSPELNPVERVWLYLKERFLSLRLLSMTTTPSCWPPREPGDGCSDKPAE
jgi:transposase